MRNTLIAVIAILLWACADGDSELNDSPIDSKITIETRELLDVDSRRLTFSCATERVYPCVNYPLLTDRQDDENSFQLTFKSVGITDICLTALGPATASVELGAIAEGEYAFELNNADQKNKGTLKITESEIKLIFDHQNGIEIVRASTKRVPEKTYWGTIGYHTSASSTLVDEFLQKLSDEGAMFNKQQPGHYFYYEIDESGEIVANTENSGYYFMKAFIFQYDGDESALKAFITTDAKQYGSQLSIYLTSFRGESVNNWSK